ncbi:MAG: riboflavin synthase [Sulfolobales archaeon]
MRKIGVVDTTFSRVDMASPVIEVIKSRISDAKIVRYTVPGIKDMPVAAKKLIEEEGCDIVITLGWVGKTLTDKLSYLALSIGLINVQLMTNKHVIDVTVHEDEAESEEELYKIAIDRSRKHAENLVELLTRGREALTKKAGKGIRQGYPDVGPIRE